MEQALFHSCIEQNAEVIGRIKDSAHQLHNSVNQTYAVFHPYGYHLDMVVNFVIQYGYEVCVCEADVLPVVFGGYYHDSIEDARLTYNDVRSIAEKYMDDRQALMAAEIVYALTNEKGRTRAERAGEKYYLGIRETPYAPFVKLADRLANVTYSCAHGDALNERMKATYRREFPHFIQAIRSPKASASIACATDLRFSLPQDMVDALGALMD